ncbi:MAG: hypothetical protein ACFFAN_06065 [Promethearchaeota archaeon]
MKKSLFFKLLFILLLFNILATNVVGVTYDLGVSEEESFIWEVENYDEETYLTYFDEPDFEEDDQKKFEIKEIKEKSDYWKLILDVWDYTQNTDKFNEEADDNENKDIYKDPEDQAENILDIEDIAEMWIIATPIVNYLEEFRDHFDNPIINVYVDDDGTLEAKYALEHIEYELKLKYTLDGVAETIEYIDNEGDKFVKINITREERIPGYQFLLYVILISGLISVIVWRKKLKIKEE